MKVFSKRLFNQNAPVYVKRLIPEAHTSVLDGKEVKDRIIEYEVNGNEYYLYPIEPDWCKEVSDENKGSYEWT